MMSACTPAPPEGSEPANTSTTGGEVGPGAAEGDEAGAEADAVAMDELGLAAVVLRVRRRHPETTCGWQFACKFSKMRNDDAPSCEVRCYYPHFKRIRPRGRGKCKMDTGFKTWMCLICGWVYDEEKGAPEDGLAPGTRWEDVPMNWTCPECGARKEDFELVEI
jgi:rubredoxin